MKKMKRNLYWFQRNRNQGSRLMIRVKVRFLVQHHIVWLYEAVCHCGSKWSDVGKKMSVDGPAKTQFFFRIFYFLSENMVLGILSRTTQCAFVLFYDRTRT